MYTLTETAEMFKAEFPTCEMRKPTGILDDPSGHVLEGNSGTDRNGNEWAFITCKICGEEMHWIS